MLAEQHPSVLHARLLTFCPSPYSWPKRAGNAAASSRADSAVPLIHGSSSCGTSSSTDPGERQCYNGMHHCGTVCDPSSPPGIRAAVPKPIRLHYHSRNPARRPRLGRRKHHHCCLRHDEPVTQIKLSCKPTDIMFIPSARHKDRLSNKWQLRRDLTASTISLRDCDTDTLPIRRVCTYGDLLTTRPNGNCGFEAVAIQLPCCFASAMEVRQKRLYTSRTIANSQLLTFVTLALAHTRTHAQARQISLPLEASPIGATI